MELVFFVLAPAVLGLIVLRSRRRTMVGLWVIFAYVWAFWSFFGTAMSIEEEYIDAPWFIALTLPMHAGQYWGGLAAFPLDLLSHGLALTVFYDNLLFPIVLATSLLLIALPYWLYVLIKAVVERLRRD